MRTVRLGQIVQLKPDRAEAYGLDTYQIYRVINVFCKPGYKAQWLELEGPGMQPPLNKVKASEVTI
jgi:hypothetical protein